MSLVASPGNGADDPEQCLLSDARLAELQAIGKAYESTTQIPLGCYYKIDVPTFEDQISTGRPNGMDSILHPNLWERDLSKLVDSLR